MNLATLWSLVWCPSFGGDLGGFVYGALHLEVTLVDTFGGFGVGFVGDLDEALEVTFGDWWCFAGDLDEAWWLETLLHDDLETWHLTWCISWVGSQEPCLLVLAWSWLWRGWMMWLVWDDDQTDAFAVAVTVFFILPCKLGLAHSEGWIPQIPLGWIQENTSWV